MRRCPVCRQRSISAAQDVCTGCVVRQAQEKARRALEQSFSINAEAAIGIARLEDLLAAHAAWDDWLQRHPGHPPV